jgi:hypothetical protein
MIIQLSRHSRTQKNRYKVALKPWGLLPLTLAHNCDVHPDNHHSEERGHSIPEKASIKLTMHGKQQGYTIAVIIDNIKVNAQA